MWTRRRFGSLLLSSSTVLFGQRGRHKALLVDGRNNHDWRSTSPVLKRLLEETGLFQVDCQPFRQTTRRWQASSLDLRLAM